MAGSIITPRPSGWPATEMKKATWWEFQNTDSSITIPACGVVAVGTGYVTGHSPADSGDLVLKGAVPGFLSAGMVYGINGPSPVAPGKNGILTFDPAPAIYNSAVADQSADVWGPIIGVAASVNNCTMTRGYPGFEIAFSDTTSHDVRWFRRSSRPPIGTLTYALGTGESITSATPAILGLSSRTAHGAGFEGTLVSISTNRLLFNVAAYIRAAYILPVQYDSASGFISSGSYEESVFVVDLETSTDGSSWSTTSHAKSAVMLSPRQSGTTVIDDLVVVSGQLSAFIAAGSYLRAVASVVTAPGGSREPYQVNGGNNGMGSYTGSLMVEGISIVG